MAAAVGDYAVLWTHEDTRGLDVAIRAAMARVLGSNSWGYVDNVAIADMRALLLQTIWLAAQTSTTPPRIAKDKAGKDVDVVQEPTGPDSFTGDQGRIDFAQALLTTFATIHDIARMRGYPGADLKNIPTKFYTDDGFSARVGESVEVTSGVEPLVVVGWVAAVGILAYAGVSAYSSYQTQESLRVISTESTKRMLVEHSGAMAIWYQHLAAEAKAGKQLPLSEAETTMLAHLKGAAKRAYDAEANALKELPKGNPDLLSGVKDIATIAVIGLVAWAVTKGH